MGEVLRFDNAEVVGDGRALHPDKVLENNKGDFAEVVIVGRDHDGNIRLAGSHGSLETLWLLRKGEKLLLSVGD